MPLRGLVLFGALLSLLIIFSPTAAEAGETGSRSAITKSDVCKALAALEGKDDAVATTFELFTAMDGEPAQVAESLVACLTATAELAPAEKVAVVCEAAAVLNEEKDFDEAAALIKAFRLTEGNGTACKKELLAAEKGSIPASSPEGLGELWTSFSDEVLKPLVPIAVFAGAFTLVLVALGRILAFVPPIRDLRSRRGLRVVYWTAGLGLAIVVPLVTVARGLWVMRDGVTPGFPLMGDGAPDGLSAFASRVVSRPGGEWWLLIGVAAISVVLLGFGFASRRRVGIKIALKTDGTGLDSTRLMATIDSMAGSLNRGLEYPVGTDITSAAASIKELSTSKFVAFIQLVLSAILGSTPWQLAIENESEDAVSIEVSRNGKHLLARRLEIKPESALAGVTDVPKADRLAALVAAEMICIARERYRSELLPGLHGATMSESIAFQFIATNSFEGDRGSRATRLKLLQRAAQLDINNRAAAVTLDNFVYRGSTSDEPALHWSYFEKLCVAVEAELRHTGTPGANLLLPGGRMWRARRALPESQQTIPLRRARRNVLLLRLLQAIDAAGINSRATEDRMSIEVEGKVADRTADLVRALQRGETAEVLASARNALAIAKQRRYSFELSRGRIGDYAVLLRELLRLRSRVDEPPALQSRRRLLNVISAFRDTQVGTMPEGLEEDDASAWKAAPAVNPNAPMAIVDRMTREEAVLMRAGSFGSDPDVAYSLACHRAERGWLTGPTRATDIEELLAKAFIDVELREWASFDPELRSYREQHPREFARLVRVTPPAKEEKKEGKADLVADRLIAWLARS